VRAPVAEALLAHDDQVRAECNEKLAAEPAFAADGDARLAWLTERLPDRSPFRLTYPVLREEQPAGNGAFRIPVWCPTTG